MNNQKPTRFSQKLDDLPKTLRLVADADHEQLARAFRSSTGRAAIGVGSGGSAIVAEYFARCRETLSDEFTLVQTPTAFVVGSRNLADADVWLFSAGADNSDFRAALRAARARGAKRINIVTKRANAAESLNSNTNPIVCVHVVPVADEKDGFLATHSLVAAVAALHGAAHLTAHDSAAGAPDHFMAKALAELDRRGVSGEPISGIKSDDLLLLISDPQLAPVATLIETSLFESAICAVERTDIRNFAHGRHSWLHHRPEHTFVLCLVGDDTAPAWDAVAALLPATVRRHAFNFGTCGRLENALGIVRGLAWIEAMGKAVGIDPGKPGIADFGRALYNDGSLEELSLKLGPAVRQKRAARLERDDPDCVSGIYEMGQARIERLRSASIGGLVLDYDGTIVTTDRRLEAPEQVLINELIRLHDLGVRLGIATGRGDSGRDNLFEALPKRIHADVLMGYYNGGHIRPLSVDIGCDRPEVSPDIAATAAWLEERKDLLLRPIISEHSRVQISIRLDNIPDLDAFLHAFQTSPACASGKVRIVRSGHSLDIVPMSSAKANVVNQLADGLEANLVVLRVGDKGALGGNDHDFLTDPYGISVEDVCGRDEGCWSLYGPHLTGPAVLLRLLRALKPDASGRVRLDIDDLALDAW